MARRTGRPGGIQLDVEEYMDILNALTRFPVEAGREMRRESEFIAEDIMVPAIKSAIMSHAGAYGPKLAKTVRTRQDRIPSVKIGNSNRFSKMTVRSMNSRTNGAVGEYSGGATSNMIRYGTIAGTYTNRNGRFVAWPETITPGWTDVAAQNYYEPAFNAWQETANNLIDRWNKGADY